MLTRMPAPIAMFDDDASVLGLLQDAFESEGFAVVVCRSVVELHQAAVRGASLAIVDSWGTDHVTLGEPERQQIMTLARLVPTVLVSGRAWTARVSAAELGLAALLPKPFELEALLDIARALQQSNSQPPVVRGPATAQRAQSTGRATYHDQPAQARQAG
jgi:DNA-binding response OmpR family regulator